MSNQEASCYTVVVEDGSEMPSTQDLRAGLQKGSDEVKIETLRKIIVATVNGNPHVCGLF
jgi:coatomer subunit beta